MRPCHQWSVGLAAVLVAMLASCATQPGWEARIRTLQPQLIALGDADSLATAAFFDPLASGQWREASALAARAVAAAPERADLAMLQLVLCRQVPACDSHPLEVRLRQLDPGNGISWLYALARSSVAHDEPGVRAALSGLAQSQRVHEYWTGLVSRMTQVVAGKAGFDLDSAFIAVIGVDAAMITPVLQPITASCSKKAIVQADVLDQCRRIFAALEAGDTLLLASYGNRMAAGMWPDGSPQRAAIDARRQLLDYQRRLVTQYPRLNSHKANRVLAMAYRDSSTEQEALRAWCVELGVRPDPPQGWKAPLQGS